MPFGNIAKDVERAAAPKKRIRKPVSVSVPYAPTSTGKRAERTASAPATSPNPFAVPSLPKAIETKKRQLHRETQRKIKRLKALDTLQRETRMQHRAEGEPSTILRQAQAHGTFPPAAEKQLHPSAYKQASDTALAKLAAKENLGEPEDITHAIEIASLAGGGATAVKAGIKGIEEVGASKLLSGGANAAESLATRVGKGAASKVRSEAKALKSYPAKKVAKVKATPAKVRSAPKRARRAVATKQGRRAAAQSTARSARRHPVRSGYGASVVLPEGVLPGDATQRARAFAEGSASALAKHPAETLETTGRSLAGAITGPAALLGATASSIKHGTPEPLVDTAKEQVEGVGHIVGQAFSGDTRKAELAARKEGSLALATPIPALTRLKGYEKARTGLREKAGTARRKLASRSEPLNRRVRHAPKGTEVHVFGPLGRHEHRKATALLKQRIDNPHRVKRAKHEANITHAIAKAPEGSHVALQTLAEYGIRGEKGAALLRQRAAESERRVSLRRQASDKRAQAKALKGPARDHLLKEAATLEQTANAITHRTPFDKQLIAALDYANAHPEVYKSKDFATALSAVERASTTAPAALAGKGERARLLGQGDLLGIQRPEHGLPSAAQGRTHATDRVGAWDDLHQRDLQLKALKRQGREKFNQAKVLKGLAARQVHDEGKAFYAQARKLQRDNKTLYDALSPYTHPEHSIDQSKRMVYDDKMLAEYKRQVEEGRKRAGLAPAIYTHHGPVDQAGSGMVGAYSKTPGVEHMREGALARSDNLDRSLEGLIRGTVHLPRQREAARQFVRALTNHFKTPFTIDGKQKFVGQGSKDWNEITKAGGQFDPKSWGRLAYREWKNALNDPYISEAERSSKLQSLLADAETGKVKGHEPWILMPREAIKEAKAQVNPEQGGVTSLFNTLGRTANRAILGTNPAWEVAQTVAEGIPILLAHPELLNPAKLASIEKDIWKYRKQNPEKALELQAMAGATPISGAALRTPGDMQETYTPVQWADGAKELTRGKTAREALGFAKLRTLGKIDALRQNEYRTVLMAAEADRRFRSFHAGLTGLFDTQARLANRFRGRSRAELWDWLQKDPKGKAERVKLEDYVDNVAGNWTAFSRYERDFAPLAIFYGFLRYSLRWSAWTFPKTHPIMATMAYMLAQANANQIDKLTGEGLHEAGLQKTNAAAKPSNPLAYAFPVYSGTEGRRGVLPGGSRISPGQSSLTQALSSGNPAAVLSSANPFLAAGITGLTGVESFTGEKTTKPQGWAALEQITGLAFPARAKIPNVKLPLVGSVGLGNQSLSEKGLEALGAPPRGPASKAYEKLDPGKTLRSGLYPGLPQSGKNFGRTEALSKSFDLKYGKGKIPGPFDNALVEELLYGNNGKPKPELLPKVLAAIHASEKGSAKVKEAESPFYPGGGSSDFTKLQSQLLKAVEDAWKTGPSGTPKKVKRGGIGGSAGGIGGPSAGSIGGPASGGIGGPNGVSIGGP